MLAGKGRTVGYHKVDVIVRADIYLEPTGDRDEVVKQRARDAAVQRVTQAVALAGDDALRVGAVTEPPDNGLIVIVALIGSLFCAMFWTADLEDLNQTLFALFLSCGLGLLWAHLWLSRAPER
jgi:hypothetical protein